MYRSDYIRDAKKKIGATVQVAGWVHEVRDLGKLKFILLRDRSGILQITAKKGAVPDAVIAAISFNREDVISITGVVRENKIAPDGVELIPSAIQLLNKVSRKLPVDPSNAVPSELNTRLDFRYVDLRRKVPHAIFSIKSTVAMAFRQKLQSMDFLEIHPPSICGAATEGGADVFPIQYFENRAYLVQSPQLYKQLAVIGGLDKVMMVTPVFRAEKHNTTSHLNEVIQMDVEMGFANHIDAMDVLEQVVLHILKEVSKMEGELKELGAVVKVPQKIARYTYDELVNKLNNSGFVMVWGEDFTKEAEKRLCELLDEEIFFIYDWPTKARAFYSMPKKDNEDVCNAFDLIYRNVEIASGAQRIHIPEMIEDQLRKRGLDPYSFEFYINAFRMGAPPHAGWSIGLERLTMKITSQENIRECMLFPRDRTRIFP